MREFHIGKGSLYSHRYTEIVLLLLIISSAAAEVALQDPKI